jgi:hypothetical protein
LDHSRDYGGLQRCHGVYAAWALTDAPSGSGLTLLPASHKPGLPTPDEIRADGGALAEALQLTLQPALAAGDLLLFASGLMHTVRPTAADTPAPLILSCEYIAAMARHSPSFREPLRAEELAPPAFWCDCLFHFL